MEIIQSKTPEHLRDRSGIDIVEDEMQMMVKRMVRPIRGKIFKDIIVIWCGKLLQYAVLHRDAANTAVGEIKTLDVDISDDVEILRVIRTVKDNAIQIIAIDYAHDHYLFLTWDLIANTEVQVLQESGKGFAREYFVVKGMNRKMNYFVGNNYLSDLEHNMPMIKN